MRSAPLRWAPVRLHSHPNSARHRAALEACVTHLDRLLAGAGGLPELAAEDLRLAVRALGEIGGQVGVEDVLDRLFAGFCIGK